MESKLRAGLLYIGDNGRTFCEAQRCAGMTARATGRDLSGQRVQAIGKAEADQYQADNGERLTCETCGAEATR